MESLVPFFIILVVGLFFSRVFARLHLPWVVALILGGILVGPYGADIVSANQTIDFFAQIGLVFLMFLAGLEVRFRDVRKLKKEVGAVSLFNALIPFGVGLGIAFYFGLGWGAALLVGIIFISSSVAVVVPSLDASRVLNTRLGRTVVATTVIEDVLSLVALSIFLQVASPQTSIPLPLFYGLLAVAIVALRFLTPKIHWLFHAGKKHPDNHEQELRAIIIVLLGTVVIFELLGLHAIIAGFFSGFVLADVLTRDVIREKLHTLAYGIFVPIFFVVVGIKTDISVFADARNVALFAGVLVLGSILAKFVSGWLGGRVAGFGNIESLFIGSATIPQLSTTLAAAFTVQELGLLDGPVITALVMLSIITTMLSPFLVQLFSKKEEVTQVHVHN